VPHPTRLSLSAQWSYLQVMLKALQMDDFVESSVDFVA
jgi:hypothetical protein